MPEPLQEAKNLLVRRWGEMGGYWGINRTMAEIHALLFVTREPLCTDDIMDQLKISRGNASMNLRALVDWGLIERVHKLGDRKEYFQADTDVWHMFETITRERRRREVEPIIATIDRCCELVRRSGAKTGGAETEDVREFHRRIEELRRFLATMGTLFELVLEFGSEGVEKLGGLLAPPGKASKNKVASAAAKGW
jgi:DNA-binding transcriptional regulator GbsR (MarR family)